MSRTKNAPARGLFFLLTALALAACRSSPEFGGAPGGGDSFQERLEAAGVVIPGAARAHLRPTDAFFPRRVRENLEWRRAAPGVMLASWDVPRHRVHNFALRIDLEGMPIAAYPAAGDVEDGVFLAKKPVDFARESGAAVVINATPHRRPGGLLSRKRALSGVFRAAGRELSPPAAKYAALGFYPGTRAFVARAQNAENGAAGDGGDGGAGVVAGGFFTILEAGAVTAQKTASLDARTACGVSRDGKTLFILVAKGSGGAFGRGMSYEECGLVLAHLGAYDALQMDGGSSSSLVVNGEVLAGGPGVIPGALLGFGIAAPRDVSRKNLTSP